VTGFGGFPSATFEWFEGLERDNSRPYFQATREIYDRDVRGALEAMFDALSEEFGGELKLFRQQRDVRFSPDKSPYKTQTYGVLGRRWYARISADGLYAGTGYYMLASDQLDRLRAAVADDRTGPAVVALVAEARAAGLDVVGESLKTAPRGYPRDHPRVALLRHKSLVAGRALAAGEGIPRQAALEHVASTWRAAEPLNAWLDEHVGPTAEAVTPWRRRAGRSRR
jgi:uncharacterized protein (TIGR02453 family)